MAESAGRCAAAVIEVDEETRGTLQRTVSSVKAQVKQVLRARIVLAAGNGAIARRLAVSANTVRKWRGRFAARGLEGLKDAARPGRPRRYDDLVRVAVVAAATSTPPGPAATWTHASIAAQLAGTVCAPISAAHVGRILADLDLKPHKVRGWLTRRGLCSLVSDTGTTANGSSLTDEMVREGARRMLAATLEAEVNASVAALAEQRTRPADGSWSATATTSPGRSPPLPGWSR